ncbi:MAG: Panacea domain-containing protein [Octadecabacter sp.]
MTAQVVAGDIFKIAKRRGMALTPMQFMKLGYISYGWYLAMNNAKLVNDPIEAWKNGPVFPDHFIREHYQQGLDASRSAATSAFAKKRISE